MVVGGKLDRYFELQVTRASEGASDDYYFAHRPRQRILAADGVILGLEFWGVGAEVRLREMEATKSDPVTIIVFPQSCAHVAIIEFPLEEE